MWNWALSGGSVLKVYRLTTACHQVMTIEQANHIEALCDDESHLNKYLLNHKPTKVLSPEYMWDKKSMEYMLDEHLLGSRTMITRKRSVVLVKNNEEMQMDEGSFQKETREGVIDSQP
ncbi:histo-blood group ABO system transferase 2-like [Rhinopithecus roxellana]|uniref:histo-blood group ABO system transferase 2-like n=1 Tax=Rhinopithecus roxellana TaxID=61622 RepID=UPI00123751E4|nr:histo-blood group ABO system transferase 2-like [Rhinopithecus roxellana]